jgi:hypothetical protein
MRHTILLAGTALLLTGPVARGQNMPSPAEKVVAMRPFEGWVGEWQGSGWSVSAAGRRTEFKLTETVQREVGGTVLLVRGRGTATSGSGPDAVTHDGLALVFYDSKAGRYHWSGHELLSGAVEAEPKLIDGGFEWAIAAAGGGTTVRFTIKFDEKEWHEFGEVSSDGRTWTRFMEMTLFRR